jgi:L-amino acid N-acyltransferase YncA
VLREDRRVLGVRRARSPGPRSGRRALEALIEESRKAGLHKLVSRIFPENVASRAACRAAGFREVGVYKAHGQLEGVWKDCVVVERLVGG